MSKEMIFSGYCRVLDQSRMVMTECKTGTFWTRIAATAHVFTKTPVKSPRKFPPFWRKPRNRHNTPHASPEQPRRQFISKNGCPTRNFEKEVAP